MDIEDKRKEFDSLRKQYREQLPSECVNCGSTENIDLHLVVPLVHGGTNIITNVVPICRECHALIHNDIGALKSVHSRGKRGFQRNSRISKIPDTIESIIDEKGAAKRAEVLESLGYKSHTLTANWIRYSDYLDNELQKRNIVEIKDRNDKRYTVFIKQQKGA